MTIDRDRVMTELSAEQVAQHLGIAGQWRGRWLRSRRCGVTEHGSDAFGLARDGMWHCHACDQGGDLLSLLAVSEGLDVRVDFPRVLALAAGIAGVEDDADTFGAVTRPPPKRPATAAPPLAPLHERIHLARRRAAWIWDRLHGASDGAGRLSDLYLRELRHLPPDRVRAREDIRETPMRCTPEELARSEELRALARSFSWPALAVPVRSVADGHLVDVRVRRFEPRPGQPKIIGMLGGVTTAPAEPGRARGLVGCYGRPHHIDADLVIVVEGALDYLTALVAWPGAQVLGAVEAGSLALVAAHAARQLAARDDSARLVVVEQADPPRTTHDGRTIAGAADAAVNEDPNAATKVMVRILGPQRVGWLFCGVESAECKDLNDLYARGADLPSLVRWWSDVGRWP